MEDPTGIHFYSNTTSDTKGGGLGVFFFLFPTLTNFLMQTQCPTI